MRAALVCEGKYSNELLMQQNNMKICGLVQ